MAPSLPDYEDGEVARLRSEREPVRWVDVSFGPPLITLSDGRRRREPPTRRFEVERVDIGGLPLSGGCERARTEGVGSVTGSVALRVGRSGRVQYVQTAETTGDDCADAILVAVAEDLWYQWLPTDEIPAPIDLVQPMTVQPST